MLRNGNKGKAVLNRTIPLRDRKTDRALYQGHKDRAKRRGIKFKLTIEKWVIIWLQALGSDWKIKRGRGPDKYCMARFGDKGPYAIGNVKIITNAENASEQKWTAEKRAKHSRLMKKIMADPKIRLNCSIAKRGKSHPQSLEARAKISLAHLGKPSLNKSLSKLGKKNPMFGWKWFNNGKKARLMNPDAVSCGWTIGRKVM